MVEVLIIKDNEKIFDSENLFIEIEKKYNNMGRRIYNFIPFSLLALNIDMMKQGKLHIDLRAITTVVPIKAKIILLALALFIGSYIIFTFYRVQKKEKKQDKKTLLKNICYLILALLPSLVLINC